MNSNENNENTKNTENNENKEHHLVKLFQCTKEQYDNRLEASQGHCLVGETKVVTDTGVYTLEQLRDKLFPEQVHQFGNYSCRAEAKCLASVDETILVKFKGTKSTLEGTPDHKVMLLNHQYTTLEELKEGDVLMEVYYHLGVIVESVKRKKYKELVPVFDIVNMSPEHNYVVQLDPYQIVVHNSDEDVRKKKGRKKKRWLNG